MSYLAQMTLRLSAGAMCLREPLRCRHGEFLAAAQNADGGFSGREGPSDLYYTGFALRGLALLGRLDEGISSRAARFLEGNVARPLPTVDFLSLVLSAVLLEAIAGIDVFAQAGRDRKQLLLDNTNRFRRSDGGCAKTERSGSSSTYHTFLVTACLELAGADVAGRERMAAMVRSRQRPDGGFVELDGLDHSGTNPTAAAVGLLRLLDALDGPARSQSSRFLAGMQNHEGGLRANTRIAVADLLSTFAGLTALADLESFEAIDAAATRRYVESLQLGQGGFRGAAWDDRADLEYTFYGLGTLALLEGEAAGRRQGSGFGVQGSGLQSDPFPNPTHPIPKPVAPSPYPEP
jgi:geranylgeranyl transferase type-2 subunit beta